MTLDEYFEIGRTVPLGSYTFDADAIKAFAHKYDPQPFHVDERAATDSMFGGLCASGWHTASIWMKLNLATPPTAWTGTGAAPVFGPSPGLSGLVWKKPVFAGETVAYSRTALSHRAMTSRTGWRILTVRAQGIGSAGTTVIEFQSAVLVKVD